MPEVIPIHCKDCTAFVSPLLEFAVEMGRRALADRIVQVERGGCVTV